MPRRKRDKGSNIEPRDSSDVNRGTLVAEVTYHVLQSEVKSTVTNSKFKLLTAVTFLPPTVSWPSGRHFSK